MLATPTQPGTTSRAGKPWSGASSAPFHLERDQHVVDRLADGQRAPDAAGVQIGVVEAVAHDVDRVGLQAGAVEDLAERDTPPLRRADPAELPRRALHRRALLAHEEVAAAAAGALDHRRQRARGQALEVGVAQRERTSDTGAVDVQAPAGGVDQRRARVVADEEPLGRNEVVLVAHRLQRISALWP
ncbi:MAG TPA: hypothetical protein VFX51_23850 [Solirubrobacteraceae bacterium]|nr:hypothetical protein [Solirubrobacteraceae bacterium]